MLSQQQNEILTRVSPGMPAGELLRCYWLPAALTEELDDQRPLAPVRLMGEDLVLFRDQDNKLGLIQRHCPHRGADLCYGRLESGGLRCVFHGWLFDRDGRCLEQPAEPADSQMYSRIRAKSYPVCERNGIVFAYLGRGDPPPLPGLDCLLAPDSHVFSFKGLWRCNWLQALEVGIDPAHASFLHRFLEDEDPRAGYGRQFRDTATGSDIPMTRLLREFAQPEIRVENTDYGLRLLTLRQLGNDKVHVRVTNQVFPCAITIPMSRKMNITQWHVPIDDGQCYWFSMFTSYADPVDKTLMREQRLKEHRLPDYAPIKNAGNHYGYDQVEQQSRTYTGMGADINVHDQWACESMGAIQDRTDEHLGRSDIAIIRYRRLLKQMIEAVQSGNNADLIMRGADSAGLIADLRAIDVITDASGWQQSWIDADNARRLSCSWQREATRPPIANSG